jgi:hypothetical protein
MEQRPRTFLFAFSLLRRAAKFRVCVGKSSTVVRRVVGLFSQRIDDGRGVSRVERDACRRDAPHNKINEDTQTSLLRYFVYIFS